MRASSILNGGGTIGSDSVINVTAANISTGGALNAAIVNSSGGGGGNIVGSANINFNLTRRSYHGERRVPFDLERPRRNDRIGCRDQRDRKHFNGGTLNAAIDNSRARSVAVPIRELAAIHAATRASDR